MSNPNLKLALSKTDSRLILAILILLVEAIMVMTLFYWGMSLAVVSAITGSDNVYISAAQFVFSGFTPIVALAWQWYFQVRAQKNE